MNKSVCFFNTNKVWGGGEKWHLNAAKSFKDDGYHVCAVAKGKSELYHRLMNEDIPTYALNIGNCSYLNPQKIIKIINILRDEKVDAIFLNLSSDMKIGGLAAKLAGIKQIIYRRGQAVPVRNTVLNRFFFRKVLTHIVANSEDIKRKMLQNNKALIPSSKIHVIYNGVDMENLKIEESKPIYTKKSNEIILGNAGRLVEQKSQKYLIDLAHQLKSDHINFKLLIAGTGPLEHDLKMQAKKMGVEDCILFTGFIKSMKSFFQSIDIFLLSSLHEGTANTVLEAMAFQLPVIAFNLSSNPEFVIHEETGYLVEFPNIDIFAAKVKELTSNPSLRHQFGINATSFVNEKFNRKRNMDSYIQLLTNP